MKSLTESLETISEIVQEFETGAYKTPEKLAEMHRLLSTNMYYLTKLQVDFKSEWQRAYWKAEGSNAHRAMVADTEVKELYLCRKILEAAKGVSISMTTELQIMKND